jgi:hypothetical protein
VREKEKAPLDCRCAAENTEKKNERNRFECGSNKRSQNRKEKRNRKEVKGSAPYRGFFAAPPSREQPFGRL